MTSEVGSPRGPSDGRPSDGRPGDGRPSDGRPGDGRAGNFGALAIASTRRRRQARDWQLVLAASGVPNQVLEQSGEYVLVLPRELPGEARAHALRELQLFEAENRGWPRVEELPEVLTQGSLGVALWLAVLVACEALSRWGAFGADWLAAGTSIAERVRAGEAWRAITALCLHADLYHLAGNAVFGALFVGLACQIMGTGAALAAVLASGALGNLANAWLQPGAHASIGASTAVFGALGILVGHRMLQRARTARARVRRFVPLFAGLILLGYLGVGGTGPDGLQVGRVDVWAHVLGFGSGAIVGALRARWFSQRPARRTQAALGWASAAALGAAWWLALRWRG